MNIENQVVSLDLAKELRDNGYPQKGWWWWVRGKADKKIHIMQGKPQKSDMLNLDKPVGRQHYIQEIIILAAAPTVAELGKELKTNINNIRYSKKYKNYAIWLQVGKEDRTKNEADARAKMWLYLKKENLV